MMEPVEEDCCIYQLTSYISWEEHSKIGDVQSYSEDIQPFVPWKNGKKHKHRNCDIVSILLENKERINCQPSTAIISNEKYLMNLYCISICID